MDSSARRARATEIVAALSRDEKIALVSGRDMWHLQPVESAGIPPLMLTDGPHGIRKASGAGAGIDLAASVPATCFPPAATLASSWDPTLAGEVGTAIGAEARALGVSVVLGPGLNLKRHPACGRNFEYFSEDPLLAGRMAASLVRGIQSNRVGACLKHFAFNNQEYERMTTDVIVDERTAHELYLRGFEIAVREGGPLTVMCAYNRVNGVYCSDNPWLLTGVLRDQWGFDGVVMSDWGAVNDRVAGLRAGLDLEMPSSSGSNDPVIARAIDRGALTEGELDAAARRVVELQLRAVPDRESDGTFDVDDHHELARRAAAESTVLLTNDGILPLKMPRSVAVIGAFARAPRYQGAGSSQIVPTRLESLWDALTTRGLAGSLTYAPGYTLPDSPIDESAIAEAVRAAQSAESVVLMVGLPEPYESEGFDRADLRLPEQHDRLVEAVRSANPRTVVVLSNGAPVELPWADRPAAIVEAYLGGQAGGAALADVLLGDREPGGRLAETFPLSGSDILADRNFPGVPRQVQYRENLYVGYRQFVTTGEPVRFPFGHGLSYTRFELGEAQLSSAAIDADETVTLSVVLRNTGDRSGSTVVQVYVRPLGENMHRPERELRGFTKVRLEAGAEAAVGFELGPDAFSIWDTESHGWQVVGGGYEILVGFSSADIRTTARLMVRSEFGLCEGTRPPGLIADDSAFARLLGRPVPQPEPVRPFTRNSTLGEVSETALGRRLGAVISGAISKQFGGAGETSAVMDRMLESVVAQMPLRSLVSMGGGRVSWKALDAIVEALNGRWIAAAGRLVRRR
ncbi:MAG: glycoside hydrolase family 3 C-terminal domain-containing protein [Coriobacteriia bacterium]